MASIPRTFDISPSTPYKPDHLAHPRYRADIDGLRAISVLAVIFYHYHIRGFSGGYVGVDVFFVISGYVITSLIEKDYLQGTFSLPSFWSRRARRILPALLTVMLVSVLVAWFILMPGDFMDFGRSLFAQALSISNIYFWQTAGYFSAPAETKPLLHTWSLSVEEQFYLFFPALYVYLLKAHPKVRFYVIALLFAISLWLTGRFDRETAFFLLPTRAWELLLGAALVQFPPKGPRDQGWRPELLALLGFASILCSIVVYDANTSFDSLAVVLPCLGAAAIIFAGRLKQTWVNRILCFRPLVFVGLISYSLYLWHWPTLVFLRYASLNSFSTWLLITALLITFGAAFLSYKYIETPFRLGLIEPRKSIRGLVVSILVVLGIGVAIISSDGYPHRIPDDIMNAELRTFEAIPTARTAFKVTDNLNLSGLSSDLPIDLILWGDSHAGVISPILEELSVKHKMNLSIYECPPVLGVYEPLKDKSLQSSTCYRSNNDLVKFITDKKIRKVVMASFWSLYTENGERSMEDFGSVVDPPRFYADASLVPNSSPEAREVFSRNFRQTIDTLTSLDVEVFIVNLVPTYRYNVSRYLVKVLWLNLDPEVLIRRPLAEHRERMAYFDDLFAGVSGPHVHILDPALFLCKEGVCYGVEGRTPLYRDTNHLTLAGAKKLRPMLEPVFGK